MHVLADTNVWCDYFRDGEPGLNALLEYDFLAIHPLVIGELSVGCLPNRLRTIKDLRSLPHLEPANHEESHYLLEQHVLWGKGLQWNDILILASVVAAPDTLLWTKDKRLASAAESFSVRYSP
ncbi:MAG: PIN domain-containing protein [Verrucomicrobia bacterium]|nr:PIN domain-containing protein [Verrucomicrobiota bacterium]MDA1006857.1 PIN domain-containing protein [Verrucomicrobiota bacterium]